MTDNEMRVRVLNAWGWRQIDNGRWRFRDTDDYDTDHPPDPLNDLNAMHEAEKTLRHDATNPTRWSIYCDHLAELCESLHDSIHATARQRAEAFLAVIETTNA